MKLIYGNTHILHGWCPKCNDTSFCDSNGKCLDCKAQCYLGGGTKRESTGNDPRRKPSLPQQKFILASQNNCCYWCLGEFDSTIYIGRTKTEFRKVTWDHLVPYSFTGSCDDAEFVAACQICNSIKSNLMFDLEDEIRDYIRLRFKEMDVQEAGTNSDNKTRKRKSKG